MTLASGQLTINLTKKTFSPFAKKYKNTEKLKKQNKLTNKTNKS